MKAYFLIFGLLVALPIAEIYVLIQVGSALGVLPTIALLIAISVFGAWMLRRQSLAAFLNASTQLQSGRLPMEAVADGAGLLVAAGLILTPGLITSAVGALLLIPQVRRFVLGWAMRSMVVETAMAGRRSYGQSRAERARDPRGAKPARGPARGPHGLGSGPVIEGEFEAMDEAPDEGPEERTGTPGAPTGEPRQPR